MTDNHLAQPTPEQTRFATSLISSEWGDFETRVAARAAIAQALADEYDAGLRRGREQAAKIAEQHYIPGHSVCGPGFARCCADKIRELNDE